MRAVMAHGRLVIDILSMKLFVWLLGRGGELLDSHLFFYHRYIELADIHWSNGRLARAARLETIAEAHYQAAPGTDDDHDPEAAAMAMPVPQPSIRTDAVSTTRMKDAPVRPPHDLAPSVP